MSPKYMVLFFVYLVNVNVLHSRSFKILQFISFMRRYLPTLKGLLASLATNIQMFSRKPEDTNNYPQNAK